MPKSVKKYGVCETARRMCISRTTIWRWTINTEPKKRIYTLTKFEEIRDRMWSFITAVQCVNARMVQAAMKEVHAVEMSKKTVCKYIKKLSRKRVSTMGTSKLATPERIAEYKNAYMRAVELGRTPARVHEPGQAEQVLLLVVARDLLDEQLLLGRWLGRDETVLGAQTLDGFKGQVWRVLVARVVEQLSEVRLDLRWRPRRSSGVMIGHSRLYCMRDSALYPSVKTNALKLTAKTKKRKTMHLCMFQLTCHPTVDEIHTAARTMKRRGV